MRRFLAILPVALPLVLLSCGGAWTPPPSVAFRDANLPAAPETVGAGPEDSILPTGHSAAAVVGAPTAPAAPVTLVGGAQVLRATAAPRPVAVRHAASSGVVATAEVLFPPPPADPLGIEIGSGLVAEDDEQAIEGIDIAEPSATGDATAVASDMPLVVNRLVEAYIALYQGPKRGVFLRGMTRSARYREMILGILEEEGVPSDLFYLAMVESAFNPVARSRAGACGLWQFIPGTGKLYDLQIDWWLDERFEVTKATRAAARHLKDLHAEFGDWYLAMAAYNAGAGRVRRAIARAGTNDFWRLPLPSETRNYVPAFIAAVIVGKDPERFGLLPDAEPSLATETVMIPEGTDLGVVAGAGEIGRSALQEMNPHLKRGCVPPGLGEYPVQVPAGMGARILAALAEIPEEQRLTWSRYRIVKGDSLWAVSQKTGVPIEVLREVNGLGKRALLRIGDYLRVPNGRAVLASAVEVSGPSEGRSITYRVKSGDTLWGIARHYGVTVDDLRKVNRLSGSGLAVGQKLVIARGGGKGAAATSNYLVRAGDTLFAIASRHGVSLTALLQANGLGPGSIIKPGERLVIPSRSRG